ncbi:MAG: hypothetical protein EAY75_13835 [Bacteroidetes bacterium]|nr:MAG: hypothetical protein EAY75_13835 [Bacteroidota bacterium]
MVRIGLLTLALGCLFQQGLYAQRGSKSRVDSLRNALTKAKEDSEKVKLYADVMWAHVYHKPELGLTYEEAAFALAKKLDWKHGIAKIFHIAARLRWRLGRYDDALEYHETALELYKQNGNTHAQGAVLIEIGQDYLDNGKFEKAERQLRAALQFNEAARDLPNIATAYDILCYLYDVQGLSAEATKTAYEYLKITEKLGDKLAIAHSAHMLASNYVALGNNKEALKYFQKGLKVAIDLDEKIEQVNFYTAIGNLYMAEGKFTDASTNYNTAYLLATELQDTKVLAFLQRAVGNLHHTQGHLDSAMAQYRLAENAYKLVDSKQDLALVYTALGKVSTSKKKFAESKQYFQKAKALYEATETTQSMGEYYRGTEQLDSVTGNWQSAYRQYKQYIAIRDSANSSASLQKLIGSQMQFEHEKKDAAQKAEQEKKDILAQAEIKRQLNIRNSSLVLLLVVLAFAAAAYRQRNKLAREKKRSDQLLADKELLLREIHHRVKNNLEVVSSLLALQSAQVEHVATKEAMQASQNRVLSIGIVHQKLYQGSSLGAIEMKDYFINLSESILDSFGAEERVTIECAMEQLDVDIDTAVPLGLIVNELLTNTLKYAFPEGQQGKVQIKLSKKADGVLQLQVADNGVGKSGTTQGTGFGGQLVSLLTQQLNGTMREEIHNGTKISFEFKMGKAA